MMNNFKKLLDCLNRQVSELEKLCKLKDDRIAELEKKLQEQPQQGISTWPFRGWQQVEPVYGCQHTYPFPWNGTIPPSCTKCGVQAPSYEINNIQVK